MAPETDRGHWSRMRHSQHFALLQLSQQIARFQSGGLRKGRSFNLSLQPDKRFVGRRHQLNCMSNLTCRQPRFLLDTVLQLREAQRGSGLFVDNLTAILFGSLRLYSQRGECFVDKAATVEFLDEPRIVELIEIHRADLWILRFHQALHMDHAFDRRK